MPYFSKLFITKGVFMQVIEIAEEIQVKIKELEIMQPEIKKRATEKAKLNAEYEKCLAVTIMKLKNGVEMELDGEKISSPPATLIEKIARGMTWQAKMKADESEALYKSLIANIDSVQSQLNGLQSLNRYLDKT